MGSGSSKGGNEARVTRVKVKSSGNSEPPRPKARRATLAEVPESGPAQSAPKLKSHTSTGRLGNSSGPHNLDSSATWDEEHSASLECGRLKIGMFSRVGNPDQHANEDRCTAVPDLLKTFEPEGRVYEGDTTRLVSYFGVYDGHGGNQCAETLKRKLHGIFAKHIYSANTDPDMAKNCRKAYKEAEETYCKSFASGACSVSVVLKGRKLYTANCGDSMALVVKYDPEFKRPAGPPVPLNDRHAVYLSDNERERLLKAGAEVSQQVGLEDALIARNAADGQIYKAIYPSRSFGDGDFKTRTHPIKGLIATPSGMGVGYEGPAYEMEGPGTWYVLLGCDGLWDFMELEDIMREMFKRPKDSPQQMAERLVKAAQNPKTFNSDDDVTAVVVRITFE